MKNFLASFIYDAHNIRSLGFETQRPNESIKLLVRPHFITNLPWILLTGLLTIPTIILTLYPNEVVEIIRGNILPALFEQNELLLVAGIYSLGVIYYSLINFLRWYFNVLILTNTRIIDINFSAPFNWQITQAQLEEVQDVRHTQGGLFGIVFNYGNLYIQTAGTAQNISISRVSKPGRIHEIIIQHLP